jgi:hypothetical protein
VLRSLETHASSRIADVSRYRAAAAAFAFFVASSAFERGAFAYCLSTTCEEIDACDGEEIEGCPVLRWPTGCVGYVVHEAGGGGLDAGTIEVISDLAFQAWRNVDCGGTPAGVVMQNLGQVACGSVEYNKDAGNANIVIVNSAWEHSAASHTYALTTTTFEPETGVLLNADIELNARDHDFTVSDEQVASDLLSVLTHEVGHFLGLAHSESPDATMFAFYEDGSTELRSLTADDAAGLCALYPPTPGLDETCNPLPRHGFSPECRDDQSEGDCTVSRTVPVASSAGNVALLVLGALLLRRGPVRARSASRAPSKAR